MTWHDLVLYRIARHVGATAAQVVARLFACKGITTGWHPTLCFRAALFTVMSLAIAKAQAWLATHYSVASPVEERRRARARGSPLGLV